MLEEESDEDGRGGYQPPRGGIERGQPGNRHAGQMALQPLEERLEIPHTEDVVAHEDAYIPSGSQAAVKGMIQQAAP
jgi:hypothetical protein